MATTALFPGSFDPFTAGHEAIARRVAPLFDRLVIAVGDNSDKQCMFTPDERVEIIRRTIGDMPGVEVMAYSGMTVDLCHRVGAQCIVRGIRTAADFEYEQLIASVNRQQDPSIETLLVMADADHINISSTLERERLLHQCSQPTT